MALSPQKLKQIAIDLESLSNEFNANVNNQVKAYELQTIIRTKLTASQKEATAMRKFLTIKKPSTTVPKPLPPTPPPTPSPTPEPTPNPTPTPTKVNPFEGAKLRVNQNSVVGNWVKNNPNDPNINLVKKIAEQPATEWLGGWHTDIYTYIKNSLAEHKKLGTLPTYSIYNIPNRDNGSYSAGGANGKKEYIDWLKEIARAFKDAQFTSKAVFFYEADALGHTRDWDENKRNARYEIMRDGINVLNGIGTNIYTYIDVSFWWVYGDRNMVPLSEVSEMWKILKSSGIDKLAYGFVVNTSGYTDTETCYKRSKQLSDLWDGKTFVIDTSRNGNGESNDSNEPWCNPTGRAMGAKPLTLKMERLDANIHVKPAGESDGTCKGGPNAGEFFYARAVEMAKNAK